MLDTNICIFYIKNHSRIVDKVKQVGFDACCISEITLAELLFGAENSQHISKNHIAVQNFQNYFEIIPISEALDVYAKEKARLRKAGTPVDDFDLLIGATAIAHDLVMVTNNIKHFDRLQGICLEDWS
ncbi:type II toxin-antitoxin system VapC family toxin [Candidatus Albibeggiatoa sp. nov. BB20]|uniref:type II toxin-antitoxin system VapC family toxin n=1 Tax=Candidatus Albibeggiatoa sp. nov. BB20 TaxID=3162723 RepID=UPI0033656570